MTEIRPFGSKVNPYFYLILFFIFGGLFTGVMAFIVQGRAFGFQNVPIIAVTPAFFVGAISAVIISYLVLKNRNILLGRLNAERGISTELKYEIIEREQTEVALLESEERYRLLIDRSPDAIFVHIDGKVVFVNSAMTDLMAAASADQLIGMDANDIPHPDHRERVKQFRPGMIAKNERIDFTEMRYVTLDGRTIYTEAGANLIKWGGKDAFMVVARDISERKRVEQALIESEAQLRLILNTSMDAVIGMNGEGLVTEWSAGAQLMFGYAAGEALGRGLSDLIIPPALREAHSRGLKHFLATGEGAVIGKRTEVTARRADGSEFPAELSIAHLRRDGAHLFSGFIRDITQRVQAEAERLELERQLSQAQKMQAVGQLTGGIAHDFNNLLSVTLGNAEFLSQQLGDSKGGRMANAIISAARRGGELTQRLLSFSRQQTLSAKVIYVNSLIVGMTDMLRRALGETIEIVTSGADDLWPVKADPGELENALLNLAINARDAMPDGGSLVLEAANVQLSDEDAAGEFDVMPGDYVALSVTDTGIGMTPEVLEHVFEPFFTTKAVGEGSGLGLSMVYGFAAQSGGFVDIRSQLGEGTSIRIYLPRATEPAVEPEMPKERGTQVSSVSATVLVVEDDPDVREIVVGNLSELGCAIIEAEDGETALCCLDEHRDIEVLFTDVVLPGGMSGPDIAGEARGKTPGIKVVFTSGYPHGEVDDLASDDGQFWFIRKPYRLSELAELLDQVLKS